MTKTEYKQILLDDLHSQYKNCTACPLGFLGRKQIVFGRGNPDATLLLIGEAPGKEEDLQGLPFIGRSGKLLTKVLAELNFSPEEFYVTSVVKCRPPANRTPLPLEANTCSNLLLHEQIKIIAPKLICTLGACATTLLLKTPDIISSLRGTLCAYGTIPLIPTYHPAYILRNPKSLPIFTQDLELVKAFINTNKKLT